MNENFYKEILSSSPLGYAYHKIICDQDGKPIDYQFIEVNLAFEIITGLKSFEVVGKRISELKPKNVESEFDWVQLYGDIAINGGEKQFEQYSAALNKFFRVNVYSPEKYYFISHFTDISREMKEMDEKTTILNTFNDIVFEVDKEYRFTNIIISDDKKLFMPREKIIGFTIMSIFPKNLSDLVISSFEKAQISGEKESITYKSILLDDEKWYKAEIIYKKIYNEEKYIVCIIDITESKKSEEELRVLTDEYEKVFNGTQDSMFLVKVEDNNTFRYIRNNNAHQKSTGITFEEIKDKTPQELVGESVGDIIASNYKRCIEAGSTINYEEKLYLANGQHIWATSLTPVFHEERVKYIVGSSLDITGKKRAEEELKKNLERLANIIEGTNVGTWEWNIQTGETVFNDQWAEMIGYKLDELLPVCIETWRKFTHPDDLRKAEDQLKRVFTNQLDYYDIELRMKNKDGSWIWMQDRGKVTSWDSEGKPLIMNGTHTDITRRKLMEEAIFIEKERLRTTLLSIGDAVISTDKQGNVLLLNRIAEQYTGWSQEEAFGRPLGEVFNIINSITRLKCENPVCKVLDTGNIIGLDNHTILTSKDNIVRSIEDSAAPIIGEDNEINGVVLVFRDITEKKERQEKIEYLSFHDQLTGLYNRRFYEEELKRLDNERNLPITLVMIDINGLKLTNDAFGHIAGDRVLKKVAEVMKEESRSDDIIARIGGDEFVILLPKTNFEMGKLIVTRLHEQIIKEKIDSINLSISYGWETKQDITEEMSTIFRKAENNMYRRKLSESNSMRHKTIDVILKVLYEKSEREERHSRRVSHLCAAIGVALDLSHEDINELRTTGLMHDIGKINIDDKILNKSAPLSDFEWQEIKRHPEIGYRILSSVNDYATLAEYVLAHHERWDGKGYPKGLKGREIPIEARIIAVADAYDAMRSDRPYRSALTEEAAIQEIKKNSGTQFDPEVVKVFIGKIFRE
ncbi:MAG: PAS domain S-box protein [Vulcanibacillus sp.]